MDMSFLLANFGLLFLSSCRCIPLTSRGTWALLEYVQYCCKQCKTDEANDGRQCPSLLKMVSSEVTWTNTSNCQIPEAMKIGNVGNGNVMSVTLNACCFLHGATWTVSLQKAAGGSPGTNCTPNTGLERSRGLCWVCCWLGPGSDFQLCLLDTGRARGFSSALVRNK